MTKKTLPYLYRVITDEELQSMICTEPREEEEAVSSSDEESEEEEVSDT